MVQDQIEREVVIEAPVDRVWQLLTEAEHLGTWFGDAGAEVDLRPGGELVMRWSEYGSSHARVERVEPNRLFSFRWVPGATGAGAKPADGNSTLVEFTLAEQGGATVLKVVESGFAGLEQPDEERARIFAGNVEGWTSELGELAGYATKVAA
jgi:uncharacterized protein YndB with AHSA1/START domain